MIQKHAAVEFSLQSLKNVYNSKKKKKITAHNVYVFIYGNEMLFKVGFVLANCFSMTVLRISFSFLFKDCDSQSDTADFLCCGLS